MAAALQPAEALPGVAVPYRYTVLNDGLPKWTGIFCALYARDAADRIYYSLRYDPAVVIEIRGGNGGEGLLAKRTRTQPRCAGSPRRAAAALRAETNLGVVMVRLFADPRVG